MILQGFLFFSSSRTLTFLKRECYNLLQDLEPLSGKRLFPCVFSYSLFFSCIFSKIWKHWSWSKQTYISDLRPSCFCGRMTCAEWESLVSGIGWLIIHIARETLPTLWTWWMNSVRWCGGDHTLLQFMFSDLGHSCKPWNTWENLAHTCCYHRNLTLSDRYDGSQTTFLHLAVSPSDVTPMAFPFSSNSTCVPQDYMWGEMYKKELESTFAYIG